MSLNELIWRLRHHELNRSKIVTIENDNDDDDDVVNENEIINIDNDDDDTVPMLVEATLDDNNNTTNNNELSKLTSVINQVNDDDTTSSTSTTITTTLIQSGGENDHDWVFNLCEATLSVAVADSLRNSSELTTLLVRSAASSLLRARSIASLLLKCVVVQQLAPDEAAFQTLRALLDVCLEADASVVQTLLVSHSDRTVRCELLEATALLHQTALFRQLTLHCVAKRIRPQWRFAPVVFRLALNMPSDLMSVLLTHFDWRFKRLINDANGRDNPSLHTARSVEMVRLLVAHGANVHTRSLSGGSVLHTALDQRPTVDLALLTALLHYG